MQHRLIKGADGRGRSSAEILAEIAGLGPMLPGSIRQTRQRRVNKDGEVVHYPGQPIYTVWDPDRKKQVCRRVPAECFDTIHSMTKEHARLKRLEAELDLALLAENMPGCGDAQKKTSSPRGRRKPRG